MCIKETSSYMRYHAHLDWHDSDILSTLKKSGKFALGRQETFSIAILGPRLLVLYRKSVTQVSGEVVSYVIAKEHVTSDYV